MTFALLPVLGGVAPLVVTLTLTPVMLVFGEIIPKAVAREWATSLILKLYRPLTWTSKVLVPFVALANTIVTMALRAVGGPRADTRQFVSREELKALLQLEPGEASVSTQEAEMIDKIFDLGDTTVREVMVPLVDVVMLPDTASSRDAIALIQQRGFSRIPIYGARETDVIGVVTAMDLLNRGAQVRTVTELMRQPTFVPETKRIDDLLREMQKGRNPLAIVVDEYGGATGIVTLEDIVEQIVGEIQDEHDRTPATVEQLPDGSYWVAGRTHIDELNEALDWSLPKHDYETVAGLVLATLHRIPRMGEDSAAPRVYHHGARGRRPPRRGGEDRAHGRAARAAPPSVNPSGQEEHDDARQDGGLPSRTAARPRAIWPHRQPARGRACSSSRSGGAWSATSRRCAIASPPRASRRWRPTCTTARRPASPTAPASSSWR